MTRWRERNYRSTIQDQQAMEDRHRNSLRTALSFRWQSSLADDDQSVVWGEIERTFVLDGSLDQTSSMILISSTFSELIEQRSILSSHRSFRNSPVQCWITLFHSDVSRISLLDWGTATFNPSPLFVRWMDEVTCSEERWPIRRSSIGQTVVAPVGRDRRRVTIIRTSKDSIEGKLCYLSREFISLNSEWIKSEQTDRPQTFVQLDNTDLLQWIQFERHPQQQSKTDCASPIIVSHRFDHPNLSSPSGSKSAGINLNKNTTISKFVVFFRFT